MNRPSSPTDDTAESIANAAAPGENDHMLPSHQGRVSMDDLKNLPNENIITEDDGHVEKRETVSAQGWPQQPSLLKEITIWGRLALIWQFLVILLPSTFVVLGIAALRLDGVQRSKFGDNVVEFSKYGTTVFPIVFAAVMAPLMKAVALWICERGATLGVLEQLAGSQSLAGTVERLVMLRRLDVWAVIIVCLWSLSPIGSQMSLRLLEITDTKSSSNVPISYFDTQDSLDTRSLNRGNPQYGTFMSNGADGGMYNGPALRTLIGAGAITAKKVLSSPIDQWNNVKVPQLDEDSLAVKASSDSWMAVDKIANKTWISLNGLMVQGLPTGGRSNFTIETSYIQVTCPDIIHLLYNSNNSIIPEDTFESAGFDLTLVNASQPFGPSEDHVLGSSFFDTSSVDPESLALGTPANLLYVSNAGIAPRYKIPSTLYIYNCTVTNRKVEAKINCTEDWCTATHVRPSKDDADSRLKLPFLRVEYQNMLLFIPSSLGSIFSNYASPVDHYLFGSDTPMTVGNVPLSPEALNISALNFSKRLTTVFNTVWQAGLCPYGISLGSEADFTAINTTRDYVPSSMTTATLRQVTDKAQYTVNKSHAIVLLITTIIVLACAIASLILTLITKAPDTLGYISTMTKDNVHAHVPDGGNTLSGLERARYLADVKVQLADVNPADAVGHVAFRTIDDAAEAEAGRLSKSRLYY